jgi:thiazolylpeptide-type bacteriocin precursor
MSYEHNTVKPAANDSHKAAADTPDQEWGDLSLSCLEIESLEISDFLDDALAADSELASKVMAASCTTCECCCSCSG